MHDGLIMAYLLDGTGVGRPLDWEAVIQWQPADGCLWLHLDYSDARVIKWIETESGLDEVSAAILLADETRPRYTLLQDDLLAILRGVNTNPGADPEDMVSIRIFANRERIISCRKRHLAFEESVQEMFATGRGPQNAGDFVAEIADLMVVHMADVIEDLEDRIDELADQVLSGKTAMLRTDLADAKRTIIRIRRYLSPQRDALVRLSGADATWLSPKDRAWLREVADRTTRYLEDLDAARDRATVTQEELTHRLSEQTEKRMYLLTIITTIFLPLGFITGLLGINVGGIPGAEEHSAFTITTILLLALMLIELLILKWHKWF